MPSVKYIIELSDADRKVLTDLLGKGTSPAKAILRATYYSLPTVTMQSI